MSERLGCRVQLLFLGVALHEQSLVDAPQEELLNALITLPRAMAALCCCLKHVLLDHSLQSAGHGGDSAQSGCEIRAVRARGADEPGAIVRQADLPGEDAAGPAHGCLLQLLVLAQLCSNTHGPAYSQVCLNGLLARQHLAICAAEVGQELSSVCLQALHCAADLGPGNLRLPSLPRV